ncbi:MAG: hypothetical protein AABW46_00610, partial [Nanoarchaeota archaeon]
IKPNDASSPRIRPDKELMKDYQIEEQSGSGFKIINKIQPFTPVTLGYITDEAAQCKFSTTPSEAVQPKDAFDAMEFDFGSSFLLIKHNMTYMLPSELASPQALELTNGGEFTIYNRCKDASGNANGRDYYIRFSIDPAPDLSPPEIISAVDSGSYVRNDLTEYPIKIFTNEPATCKWETRDIDYDAMQNDFNCVSSATQISVNLGYQCTTNVDLLPSRSTTADSSPGDPTPGNVRNVYYFRCRDKEGNTNDQSYPYTLVSSQEFKITETSPSGVLETGAGIGLKVITSGGAESGRSICGFSEQQDTSLVNMPSFVNTLSNEHTQPLTSLKQGTYRYYITCQDRAANENKSEIVFEVKADTEAPKEVNIEMISSGTLHLITDEPTTCEYSDKQFDLGEGTQMTNENSIEHEASISSNKVFIKCKDEFYPETPILDISFIP